MTVLESILERTIKENSSFFIVLTRFSGGPWLRQKLKEAFSTRTGFKFIDLSKCPQQVKYSIKLYESLCEVAKKNFLLSQGELEDDYTSLRHLYQAMESCDSTYILFIRTEWTNKNEVTYNVVDSFHTHLANTNTANIRLILLDDYRLFYYHLRRTDSMIVSTWDYYKIIHEDKLISSRIDRVKVEFFGGHLGLIKELGEEYHEVEVESLVDRALSTSTTVSRIYEKLADKNDYRSLISNYLDMRTFDITGSSQDKFDSFVDLIRLGLIRKSEFTKFIVPQGLIRAVATRYLESGDSTLNRSEVDVPQRMSDLNGGIKKYFRKFSRDDQHKVDALGWAGAKLAKKEVLIIYDYIQYTEVTGHVYGVGARLFIHIRKTKSRVDLSSLTNIAANVQLNRASVTFDISTIGIVGDEISKVLPRSNDFDVENYSAVMKSIDSIIRLAKDGQQGVQISPKLIDLPNSDVPQNSSTSLNRFFHNIKSKLVST